MNDFPSDAIAPTEPRRPTSEASPSRRSLLGIGLASAAATMTARPSTAAPQRTRIPGIPGTGPGLRDDLVTLIHHATQGFTIQELEQASALGYSAWLDRQLDPASIPDTELDQRLLDLPSIAMTGQELWNTYGPPVNATGMVAFELRMAAILRSVYSKRQLFERMVEFWTDHFNIYQTEDNYQRMLKSVDDRTVIRKHALGTFPELLRASARSGSMSWYLDNYASSAGSINENYAREVMELHTLSVDGPYFETDIVEVARCFTGWSLQEPGTGYAGEFIFYPSHHDTGSKTVLDNKIPAGGGISDGEYVLDLLAHHPSTAGFISRKMISWLLRVDPPQSLVDQIATVFLTTGGDIAQMVRSILDPAFMAEANPWAHRKAKRPFHFIVGLLRQTGGNMSLSGGVDYALKAMGHTSFGWHTPDGYPDTIEDWGGGVLPRWSVASALLSGHINGVDISQSAILNIIGDTPRDEVARRLDAILCGGTMTHDDRDGLQTYINTLPSWTIADMREIIALAASTPSYATY